jgi:hypothetical protein
MDEQFEQQQALASGEGLPVAEDFDDYDKYVDAKIGYQARQSQREVTQGIKEAIHEAAHPAPTALDMLDSETKAELESDLQKRKLHEELILLGEHSLNDAPAWKSPYIQKAYERKITEFNKSNEGGLILVPRESAEWQETEPVKPSSMMALDVTPQERDDILRQADAFNTGSPGQRLWRAIRTYNREGDVKPTITFPEPERVEPEKNPDDPWGSQKEFEKWRMKHGAKRF